MQTFKHLLGGAILATIALVSCAKNEVATTSDTTTNASSQYMAVNITMGSGTKSTGYESGTNAEQAVDTENSGFLFYDGNGNYVTYGEFSDEPTWKAGANSIENYTTSVILGPTATSPTQVLAIFNNSSWKNYIGKSLDAVMELATSDEWTSSSETFAMASAGLYEDSYTVTAKIYDENLCESEDEAEDNPVTIYVERQAVKVTIDVQDENESEATYILEDSNGNYYATLANSITYIDWDSNDGKSTVSASAKIVVDGWAINATNSSSHVVKNYDSSVTENWYDTSDPYNYLWAQDDNYTYSESDSYGDDASGIYEDVNYLSWSEVTDTDDPTSTNDIYTHENTIDSSGQTAVDAANTPAATPTVLLAAHITLDTDEDDTYDVDPSISTDDDAGFYYNSGVLFSKDGIIAQALEELSSTYTSDGGTTALTPEDVTITLGAYTGATTNSSVYVVTAAEVKEGKSVYKGGTAITSTTDLITALNETAYLTTGTDDDGNTTGLQYYNSGHCYYQAVITTEGSNENTAYGVVRNHKYSITLNTISWIGGPVGSDNDPLIIIPGSDETNYLAATVNVLKWITVSQTVDF